MKPFSLLLLLFAGLLFRPDGKVSSQNPPALLSQVQRVVVPSVIGENLDTAVQQIVSAGLTQGNVVKMQNNQPAGTVIRQAPGGNSLAPRGTRVNLYISSGPPVVIVPRMIGYQLDDARVILSGSQLKQGRLFRQASNVETGRVIDQNPLPGTSVPIGTVVNLTVSLQKAIPLITVPDVIGLPLKNAEMLMKNAGLQVIQINHQKSLAKNESVISQQPTAGSHVQKGTRVTLVASRNPVSPWLFTTGVVFIIILMVRILRRKLKKKKEVTRPGNTMPELKLNIIPDKGKQTLHPEEPENPDFGLYIKIIPDKGTQTLKTE